MAKSQFRIVTDGGDWGSPLSQQPEFKTLEEARSAARAYLEEQRKASGTTLPLEARIEETQEDGSIASHDVF